MRGGIGDGGLETRAYRTRGVKSVGGIGAWPDAIDERLRNRRLSLVCLICPQGRPRLEYVKWRQVVALGEYLEGRASRPGGIQSPTGVKSGPGRPLSGRRSQIPARRP